MKFRHLFISLITILLLSGCHSQHQAVSTASGSYSGAAMSKKQLQEHLAAVEGAAKEWKSVKVPVSLKLTAPRSFSVSGVLTMERNSSIHLSLRFLGMEVGAVAVTADSVFAIYKLDRLCYAASIRELTGGFPATVGDLQDLIMGRPFAIGYGSLRESSPRLDATAAGWTLTPTSLFPGIEYRFLIDPATDCPESLTVDIPDRKPVVVSYNEFTPTTAGPVASITDIAAPTRGSDLGARINMNLRKAEWNNATAKQLSIPAGYTRISTTDLLRVMSKF